MAGIPRLMVTNRIAASATVLSASSELLTAPRAWLKDQLRSKTWRGRTGWNVVTGVNDKIDFNRGGVKAATVAAGNYTTATALATAIVTALEAADATPVWACSYNVGTSKFTISSDLSFTLLFNTGTNKATSIHLDMGYTSTDKGSATSQVAEGVAYKSREWLKADLGAAATVQAGIAINHNLGASGTVTLQGNATDAWTAPSFSQVLAGDAEIRIAFFATQTLRYWRLLIDDVASNTAGYSEVGVWFAGPYTQPSVSYSIDFRKKWEELSEVTVAVSGAHLQNERPRRPVWSLSWSEIPEADRAALAAAFALVPRGRCWFLAFDAVGTPTDTAYGFILDGVEEALTSGLYFDVPIPAFAGALG